MRVSKKLVSVMVCLLTIALTAQVVFAAPPAGKGSQKHAQFSDLAEHWAQGVIGQMLDRGILTGDSAELFAPDRALTRQEAAVSFVRLLGLEDEAIARSEEALPFSDANLINPDYRGYVLVASEQGIMGGEGANFNPLGTLNRETVAVLMSRLLQLYGDKDLVEKVRQECSDKDEVDDWAISSVAALVSRGLMTAYEGHFNPKQPITKGMMAAILSRIMGGDWKYKEVHPKLRSISGPILAIDSTPPHASITIGKDRDHSDTYSMGLGVKVFLDTERAQLADLHKGDQVRLTLNPVGHVLVINASSDGEVTPVPNTTVTGTVQSIVNQGSTKALAINQANTINTYLMASNAKVTFKDWPNGTFSDILQGEKVSAKLVDNKITEVLVEPTYTLDQGIVTAISDSAVAIEKANDTDQAYLLDDHLTLVISGDSDPRLADIHVGDRVDLRIRDNSVVVMQVNTGWTVTGTISSLLNPTGSDRGVTVRLSDGTYQSYFLATNAAVTIKDYPNATFTDLQSGDKVNLRLVNGTVVQLQAELATTSVQGVVEAFSATGTKFVTVRQSNDVIQSYILAPYYTLTVEGRTNPTLNNIVVGDRIDIRLHNGLAVNLAVTRGWTATGKVQSTTTTDTYRTLTLLVDNTTQTYVLASNAVVTVKDHPAAAWTDIKAGDQVSLRMVNGTVAQLEAQFTYTTDGGTVTANNGSGDRYLAIQRSNGTSAVYWIAPYYQLTVEGKSNPALADVLVGDNVNLKLHDGKIAWITDLRGTVYTGTLTNVVNTSSLRQLTMKLENNTYLSYVVDTNATVAIKDQPQATYADLRTGDKVTVRIVNNKVVQIDGEFVYTSVEGILTNINLSTKQVTLQKTSGTQAYTIPSTAVLSIPNKTNPTLNDLALGDKVELKIRNNAVASATVTPATATSGTISALVNSGSDRAVSIKEADGDVFTYALATTATVVIKGQTTANFGNLVVGDLIQVRVIDNKVVRLEAEYAYTTVTGTVTLVDQSSSPKRIYLLPVSGGASQAYALAATYVLTIDGRTNPTLSNIVIGDQAELKIRAGLVSSITINPLHNQFTATFVRSTTSNNTSGIEVIRNGSVTNITLAANTTLVVPGKTAPTLADLRAGSTIRVTTDNNLATKIEVIQ